MSLDPQELSRQVEALTARVAHLEDELAALREGTQAQAARASAKRESSAGAATHVSVSAEAALPALVSRSRPVPGSDGRYASLESRIGSQIFNRIGIIALLVGVAWFLKFAIDQHWIGPLRRVLVGVAAGIGVIGWSEWFRARGYKAFSYSLKALGTGVLYLSLWASYTLFGLIPASAAFVAMLAVTAANAWLSWLQNSELLAFYAALGGFLTPLLLWSASSEELTLFSYLLLLDLAVLALVALRPWSRLLLAAFAGSATYAVGWYVQHYTPSAFRLTAFFVVVFFLLFSAAPQLLRNLRLTSARASLLFEDQLTLILLPLLNALLAFAELYALLSEPVRTGARAWVAFGFAAFYLGMLRVVRWQRLVGTPARLADTYLLLSVLAFTGAIPLAASGRWIALCWSTEGVMLFALAWRQGARMLRSLGGAVLMLAFTATASLNTALHGEVRMLWNARFATYLVGVVAGVSVAAIASKALEGIRGEYNQALSARRAWRRDGILAAIGATVLLMIGVCLEIETYWSAQYQLPRADRLLDEQFSYSAWSMLFGAALLAAGFGRKVATLRWLGLALLTLSIGKVFLFDLRELSQGYRILSFLGLGALLLAVSFVYQRDLLKLRKASD